MSEQVLAHPELGLIASDEMIEARRQKIGKNQLNTDRKATELDYGDPDAKIIGGRVEKSMFDDDDVREIAVAELDEKMLDLESADQSSPATTKARNDLRDLKDAMISLTREPGKSYYGTAEAAALRLDEEGRSDAAQVMLAAGELFQEVNSRPFKGTEFTAEENRTIVQAQLKAHNARVRSNEARRS